MVQLGTEWGVRASANVHRWRCTVKVCNEILAHFTYKTEEPAFPLQVYCMSLMEALR